MDNVNMLVEPIRESLHQIGAFLPRLLLAIVVLVVGWLVAKLVRFAIVKALHAINFNVVTEKAGIDRFLSQGGADVDTIRVLGGLFYWLVILAALMIAFNSLDLAYVTDLLGRESREMRGMSETQEELKNVLKTLAAAPNQGARLTDDLRSEFRLLSRTIAAAVDGKRNGA